jgi:Tfp pilus assembly protein PilF
MTPRAAVDYALKQYETGQILDAFSLISSIIQQVPDYADARFSLGAMHHDQGNLGDAIASYRSATSLDPSLGQGV